MTEEVSLAKTASAELLLETDFSTGEVTQATTTCALVGGASNQFPKEVVAEIGDFKRGATYDIKWQDVQTGVRLVAAIIHLEASLDAFPTQRKSPFKKDPDLVGNVLVVARGGPFTTPKLIKGGLKLRGEGAWKWTGILILEKAGEFRTLAIDPEMEVGNES